MKKAVTLIKGILKLPKLIKKDATKDDCKPYRKSQVRDLCNYKIHRPCTRCVVLCENTIWSKLDGKLFVQHNNELVSTNYPDELQFNSSHYELEQHDIEMQQKILGFLSFYGMNLQHLPMFCDKSCMSSRCFMSHAFDWTSNEANTLGPHFPSFILLTTSTAKWTMPLLHESSDLVLFRAGLNAACAIFNSWLFHHDTLIGLHAEIWLIVFKIQIHEVTLLIEETLVFQFFDNVVWSVFFDVPKSRDSRETHLDALYKAVDQIMDISLYITLTSGIPPENQSYIKDTIIETATVVTSTAAESTATVGIETAAMAMGQAAAGVALSVLVDVGITAGMVTRAKIRRDKGLITQKEFQRTVRYKLCDSGCQFIGGTAGTIVGQVLIPVPVVGAIVGGFCGSLLGAGVSKGIIKTSEIISKSQAAKLKAITER